MNGNDAGDTWLDEAHAYAVVTADRANDNPQRSGLSHAEAMTLAEELRRLGEVVIVMHLVRGKSHEVDRYPAR